MRLFPRLLRGGLFAVALLVLLGSATGARAALVLLGQFNPDEGVLVGIGYDPATQLVWNYDNFGARIQSFTRSGDFVSRINPAGEAADDFDLTFPSQGLTLGDTAVPAGSMLVINGETAAAEVYAVNPATGSILATLNTRFGASHVVGGTYHAGRNTLFLIADQFDSTPSTIAEVNPMTGEVLNTFSTGAGYTINFGDVEVNPVTGNLLLVSSIESAVRELTPAGIFVQDLALPTGVTQLSGIAVDGERGELWVSSSSNNGDVFRLGGLAAIPEPQTIVMLGAVAAGMLIRRRR